MGTESFPQNNWDTKIVRTQEEKKRVDESQAKSKQKPLKMEEKSFPSLPVEKQQQPRTNQKKEQPAPRDFKKLLDDSRASYQQLRQQDEWKNTEDKNGSQ